LVRYYTSPPVFSEPRNQVLYQMVERNALPHAAELVHGYSHGTPNSETKRSQSLVDLNDWPLLINLIENKGNSNSKGTLLLAASYLLNSNFKVTDYGWQQGFSKLFELVKSNAWATTALQSNLQVELYASPFGKPVVSRG